MSGVAARYGVEVPGIPTRAELEPWVLRYLQDRHRRSEIRVLQGNAWEFQVLGGLLERVRRSARAYLLLERKGLAAEGRILIRSALEHAVTAQWAYLVPGGISRLEVSLLANRANYAATMNGGIEDPEWADLVETLDRRIPRREDVPGKKLPGLPKFTQKDGILPELDATGYLKRAYTVLSRVNHVTDEAVADYFTETDEGLAIVTEPEARFIDDAFHTLATACCLASWILARLEDSEEELRVARSQGLLWRLDTHLSASRRRFPDESE